DAAEKAGDWAAARQHLDFLIAARPGQARLHARRGEAGARLGQWQAAADDLHRATTLDPRALALFHHLALCQLRLGRADDYRKTCARLLERLDQVPDPQALAVVLQTCVLGLEAVDDYRPLLERAQKPPAAKGGPALPSSVLGRLLYRAGRHEEAAQRLKQGFGQDQFYLAMAQQRLKKEKEAREALARALQWLERMTTTAPPGARAPRRLSWQAQLELQLLRQEAEALINKGS